MNETEIRSIQEKIESLPKGSIYLKKINGKEYEYWQFSENGRTVSRRVKGEELSVLKEQIAERRRLEALLKKEGIPLKKNKETAHLLQAPEPQILMRTGHDLIRFTESVSSFHTREIFGKLKDYIDSPASDKVFILYGLRRTGKTTMIRQAIRQMNEEHLQQTAFLQVVPGNTMAQLNQLLHALEKDGYRYLFIDEVTLLDDFIEGAAVFSDIFAASGMKIVLSGTDSLGFLFSEDEQLYDRCILLHTTYIPYREFENVLGIHGIDEYIRCGGTMSMGGNDYNKGVFTSTKSTNEYIDSAIVNNIQHSLKNYQHGSHFRSLYDLYEKNELTSAINRVIEDMNHQFTVSVLTDAFKSHDPGISAANLRHDRYKPTDVLDRVDQNAVTERLRRMLEIKNKEEQQTDITEENVHEIQEYLSLLDLINTVDVISSSTGKTRKRTIFTQPGMRYCQASALISSLMQDETFRDPGIQERNRITERILSEVRGRMMEDIVLLETKTAMADHQVFVLQFAIGEFDMVVFNPRKVTCRIYEVKHSREYSIMQARHLKDAEKCAETEKQYGRITGRYVIYQGEESDHEGIQYLNVEAYLKSLK